MALSVISATLIMPKANLQLPIFKPQKHPKNGIIKCCKPPPPPVKKGPPGQTNSKEKKMTAPNTPVVKEKHDKGKPKRGDGSSEKSMA
ncbi:hypothetical protein Pint_04800 [Pistacia integerrima]|uniref:Uncharacterized protein n=1 Tax=Pistacia integerrima TaxID=434235 RepID=A0ACC0ZA10_9ROSI|nr:hypothetical protein Pint_04800 [Pistacia integerrima]